ncbi:MAG: type II toxin-antitoxin system RelE/ParE family toxin [Pseudomonadota bacterium]
MKRYALSRQADEDMVLLYMDGAQRFGERRADAYHDGLETLFQTLADYPEMARLRSEYEPPVRIQRHRSHIVIYDTSADGILIVRVRHGHEDWQNDPHGTLNESVEDQ